MRIVNNTCPSCKKPITWIPKNTINTKRDKSCDYFPCPKCQTPLKRSKWPNRLIYLAGFLLIVHVFSCFLLRDYKFLTHTLGNLWFIPMVISICTIRYKLDDQQEDISFAKE